MSDTVSPPYAKFLRHGAAVLTLLPLGCGFFSKKTTPAPAAAPALTAVASATRTEDPGKPARASVGEPVTVDGLTVRVVSVEVGNARVYAADGTMLVEDKQISLQVGIEVRAGGKGRTYDYWTWRGPGLRVAKDDAGRGYGGRLGSFSADYPGFVSHRSLGEGEQVTDTLVYDPPVGAAKYIELELPGKNVGVDEAFRLRIPREAWSKK